MDFAPPDRVSAPRERVRSLVEEHVIPVARDGRELHRFEPREPVGGW